MTGTSDRKPLPVGVKSSRREKYLGEYKDILLWVTVYRSVLSSPPAFRRMGIGSEILTRFENEGRKRGCSAGFVYTICFQAPDFYKKHGWEEFGRIDRKAEGTSRIFMKKSLYIFNAIAKKEQCEFTALQVLHLR
ncbi:GNAT family N-acetyltransferase [Pantoea allii]|uniref:GNAT family N-acetyltransferase n=2 Tax=Pantoea allii TaxID=574096 RepID=UPI0027D81FBB|nr:GNAT family N-acetyltransferase [Pantoea allii]